MIVFTQYVLIRQGNRDKILEEHDISTDKKLDKFLSQIDIQLWCPVTLGYVNTGIYVSVILLLSNFISKIILVTLKLRGVEYVYNYFNLDCLRFIELYRFDDFRWYS